MLNVSQEVIPLFPLLVVSRPVVTRQSGVVPHLPLPRREIIHSTPPRALILLDDMLTCYPPFLSVSGVIEVRDKAGSHRLGFVLNDADIYP